MATAKSERGNRQQLVGEFNRAFQAYFDVVALAWPDINVERNERRRATFARLANEGDLRAFRAGYSDIKGMAADLPPAYRRMLDERCIADFGRPFALITGRDDRAEVLEAVQKADRIRSKRQFRLIQDVLSDEADTLSEAQRRDYGRWLDDYLVRTRGRFGP